MANKYRPDWTQEQIESLLKLRSSGKSARDIYLTKTFPAQSLNAIQKKLCRLGLVKKIKISKFKPEIKEEFKKFLIENWEKNIPEDLVALWNQKSPFNQTNKRKVISYLTKLNIKIPYYEVQRIKTLRKKEKKIIENNKCSLKIMEEKIRSERVKLMRKRVEKGRDIWSGKSCDLDFES